MQQRFIHRAALCGFSAILILAALAQEPTRPKISITGIPPEPIQAGNCTYSTSGYLELANGKTVDFTDAEFGRMILPALHEGYVITLYPVTKRGIFVNSECHSIGDPQSPKRP